MSDSDTPEISIGIENKEYLRNKTVELAQMQTQLVELIGQVDENLPISDRKDKKVFVEKRKNGCTISSYEELHGKIVEVSFSSTKTNSPDVERMGINAPDKLTVFLHTDTKTKERFESLEKTDPHKADGACTIYMFNDKGNCDKISIMPREVVAYDYARKPVINPEGRYPGYASDMNNEDFKIAEDALHALIERVHSVKQPTAP